MTIDTAMGRMTLPGQGNPGDSIFVSYRPEQLYLGRGNAESTIELGEVRVQEVTFQGTHRLCRAVNSEGNSEQPILLRLSPEQPVGVGDLLSIHARRDQAVLLDH